MDAVLAALADDSRRAMLTRLLAGPATAGELGEGLTLAQPGVSRHLRVLREAQLVEVEARGRERIYTLSPDALTPLDDWLAPYRAIWQQRMDALHTEVARGKRMPRPGDTPPTTFEEPR